MDQISRQQWLKELSCQLNNRAIEISKDFKVKAIDYGAQGIIYFTDKGKLVNKFDIHYFNNETAFIDSLYNSYLQLKYEHRIAEEIIKYSMRF